MDYFGWVRLLIRNHFAVDRRYWPWLVIISFSTFWHTILRYYQEMIWGIRVKNTEIEHAPLFIIGHWRSGTTLLHELLALDERHTYPNNFECLSPNHFLLTERFEIRFFRFLFPTHRPMDNMTMDWESPQEDEWALCHLGLPSPFLTSAFPNHPPQYQEYLDLEGVPAVDLERWKKVFLRFLKQITLRKPKRIVLKSPTHTYRIKVLLDMFPDALFVHVVRNPYKVFLSTLKMWKAAYRMHGLQVPDFEGLEDYILGNYNHMFAKLEEARSLLDPSRFYDLRYEDLVRDPVGQLRNIYINLGLGEFEKVLPKINQYLGKRKNYKTNRYELGPDLKEKIRHHWGDIIRRYEYTIDLENDNPLIRLNKSV